ncbi:MAG: RNA polymerase sigma factor [Chitinophagales bacterium]
MSMQPPYKEREFILQIAEGNEQAFTQLFDYYRPNVYSTVLRITGDYTLSEEIVQDTFLKVWIKRQTLPKIQNFAAWLYIVAQNHTYTALRKLKREKGQSDSMDSSIELLPCAAALNILNEKEYARVLNQAIKRLPVKQQQTYRLVKEHGLHREEVALMLQVSPETVKANLNLATRSVRAFCVANLDLAVLLIPLILVSGF